MTFLNPVILWGMAAVSIPILIHIFNLRRTKKIEFSTLMFLKEIEQSKYRKIKLKQLLILLFRIGFIIMLIMLFSQPFLKGYLGSPDEKPRSSVLIILDDSFSMQSRESTGSSFENAKKKAAETIDLLGDKDEIFFTTVSEINRLEKNLIYKDKNRLKETLGLIKTSDVTKDLSEVLYFAGEILKTASNSAREVYIFTDGQKSFIENESVLKTELLSEGITKTNIILASSREANNISIDTVNTLTRIFEKNRPVRIKAVVNNRNNYNVSNKSITLSYGTLKDEKVIDIPANSTLDVEFVFQPGVTGFSGGSVELTQSEIADDEISGDNRQYFTFYIPPKADLLFVSQSQSDIEFIELALRTSEELMKDSTGSRRNYFNIKKVSPEELKNEKLFDYDAVVIVNKPGFDLTESQMLKAYIESGGGVIIYPGELTSADNYNNTLIKELGLPPIRQSFSDGIGEFRFEKIDYEHPVFEGIFKKQSDKNSISNESPVIKNGLDISAGENAISLIKLSNEKNFLVEYSKGKGKLLLFSVSPDMKNSDYPAKNLFSPISVRTILYPANINTVKTAITGKDYFVDLENYAPLNAEEHMAMKNSNGFLDSILITKGNSLLNLKSGITNASQYLIENSGGIIYSFPANVQVKESEMKRLKSGEIKDYLENSFAMDVNVIEAGETLQSSVAELRTGKEIWQYFLIGALIFLLLEYLTARSVAGRPKKEEY